MKYWQIIMLLVSIVVIFYIWYPKKDNKTEAAPMAVMRIVPAEEMRSLEVGDGPPKTVPLKEKVDLKITITWIIATLNGVMLLVMQIKKIVQ